MRFPITFAVLMLLPPLSASAQDHNAHSAHAGKETRAIKALSDDEIKALLDGAGAGFALAAELNHYPGPRHVLDLRTELALTAAQISSIERIFQEMNQSARDLGKLIVDDERALDRAFANRRITPTMLKQMTQRIGELNAELRYVHLNAHLATTALLSHDQIQRYDKQRGYTSTESTDHAVHWSYSGEQGPPAWGRLSSEFAVCSTGMRQSPVNITRPRNDAALPALITAYRPAHTTIINNGHTLQATAEHGGTLRLGDRVYELLQFHHHRPSEHTLNGKAADLEIHLVHRADDGSLGVLAVFMDRGDRGNDVVDMMIAGKPAIIDASRLLPDDLSYYSYDGSLTTPPCTEGVHWIVLEGRGRVTAEQLEKLERTIEPNARPVMPLGARQVLRGAR